MIETTIAMEVVGLWQQCMVVEWVADVVGGGWTAIDVGAVQKCMGDPNADQDHPILKHEQDAQVCSCGLWCGVIVVFWGLANVI
jgi:hypothetical protein